MNFSPISISFKFAAVESNPPFFILWCSFVELLPVILITVYKIGTPKKKKREKKRKKNVTERASLSSKRYKLGSWFSAGRWLGAAALSACFSHIALLLQGLMLADYNSVASHFRFIWTCFSSLLSFRWLASIQTHCNSSEPLPHQMVRSMRNLARGA